jgi:hypothetical protein
VSTPTFRGWRFYRILGDFRVIGSSESTRFPEGLVLGNWAKTFHPRNSRNCRIHENVREYT